MIMWSSPEMDVNRGEGLDGEHASPGRILAPSPSSQRFLGLPPTILNIFWNAFEIFNKRWNVLQSLNISFKHLLSTTFLLADMIEKCGSASKHKENYLHWSSLAKRIQFWPVSDEKKMPSTPVYDKDGLEKCSGTNPREILVRNRLFQTSPNWRENLPRLEGALFQGLGAWRIIFFYFWNHFLKIHTQGIPKMSDFSVLSHFWLRKRLSKKKKRVLTPSFPQPTSSSKWVGEPD